MPIAPLILTPGEPAGIGPDIVLSLAASRRLTNVVVTADPTLLSQRAQALGISIAIEEITLEAVPKDLVSDRIWIVPIRCAQPVQAGHLDPANGRYVLACLEVALNACRTGTASAMVTGPVQKSVLQLPGIPFLGHTEWLAQHTQSDPEQVVMLLASEKLKVALVTTHLPLRAVADALTPNKISNTITQLHQCLQQDFGLRDPVIAVCGLNPHAGEHGVLGDEEITLIEPVLQRLRQSGLRLLGPCSADSLFTLEQQKHYDAVVAMYHDQGLPVLKHQSFGMAVNVTLGLPIIRTSVDHGTALTLAGTGRASAESLDYACRLAQDFARQRVH